MCQFSYKAFGLDRRMLNLLIERCLGRKIMRIIFLILINEREILTDIFRIIVNNLFKENFYWKRKKIINILTVFFIFHKSSVKTFLK